MSNIEKAAALTEQQVAIATLVDSVLVKNTPEELERAVEATKQIKHYKSEVKEFFLEMKENAYRSWKAICRREKEYLEPGDKAETGIKRKISLYYEEERKVQAAEHAQRVKEAAEAAAAERVAEVEELRETGALEEAQHIAQQPLDLAPVAKPAETKADGLGMTERWHAKVENLGDFLSFLAGEPRFQYLVQNFPMKELNKLAQAQKEMFDIPGAKAVKELVPSIRTK